MRTRSAATKISKWWYFRLNQSNSTHNVNIHLRCTRKGGGAIYVGFYLYLYLFISASNCGWVVLNDRIRHRFYKSTVGCLRDLREVCVFRTICLFRKKRGMHAANEQLEETRNKLKFDGVRIMFNLMFYWL